mgnify:FL=1
MIELVFLISILVVCFFLLYILCRQDFVLLRQNISLSQILDIAAIAIIFAFITGRLLFLINNSELFLLHTIRFFHFVKFPGISPLGFSLGGIFALWFLLRNKKGILRVIDIFSISFLPLYLFSLILRSYPPQIAIFLPAITIIFLLTLFIFFLKSHYVYILRDGSISLMLLLIVSLDTLLYEYLNMGRFFLLFDLSPSQLLSIAFAASSLVFLFINQQKLKV